MVLSAVKPEKKNFALETTSLYKTDGTRCLFPECCSLKNVIRVMLLGKCFNPKLVSYLRFSSVKKRGNKTITTACTQSTSKRQKTSAEPISSGKQLPEKLFNFCDINDFLKCIPLNSTTGIDDFVQNSRVLQKEHKYWVQQFPYGTQEMSLHVIYLRAWAVFHGYHSRGFPTETFTCLRW